MYQTVVCMACVLILVVNGWSLFHNLGSLNAANALQTRSARVNDKLQYLNVLVMDAESSLRGYFLSGSEVYLGPMRTLTSELDGRLRELDALVDDNPSQRKNLAQLRALIYRKIDNLNQAINVYRQGGLQDIVDISANTDGKTMLDEIRLQIVIMVKEQNELLSTRGELFVNEYKNAVFLGITINVMAIVVLALFYRLTRRSYYARLATQRELEFANENLESMVVELNGKPVQLSPGAQIRDTNNRLVLPASLTEKVQVGYMLDGAGLLYRVWILSPQEQKEVPPKPLPADTKS